MSDINLDLNSQTTVTALEFPNTVREAPEIYLDGPNHCVHEIIDNSIDEAKAGVCTVIKITIDKNHIVTVQDNGRGIPIRPSDKDPSKSMAVVALSTLSAGGKFKKTSSYEQATGGKYGVGSSCVNAVSDYFDANIIAYGKVHQAVFRKGILVQDLKVIADAPEKEHGTIIRFHLDNEIYPNANYDYNALLDRIHKNALLNPKLTICVAFDTTDTDGKEVKVNKVFKYDNGLDDYIDLLLKNKNKVIDDVLSVNRVTEDNRLGRPLTVDSRFTYTDSYSNETKGFVNGIHSHNGGDQINGFNQGIAKAIRQYAVENKHIKNESDLEINDCIEGIVCLISVHIKNPTFKGQHKDAIKMPVVASIVSNIIKENLYDYMSKSPKNAKIIITKVLRARKERLAIKKAREDARGLKNVNAKAMTLGKLADCSSKNPEECEVFLVEGDSAGGSAKQGRDRKFQAILPVFGKPLNVSKKEQSIKEIIKNVKLGVVVAALRAGVGKDFDISKLRYHKIIIFSDADVDGSHIICLWIMFFWTFMPEVIKNGYLYAACPPLFKAEKKIGKKEDAHYFYSDKELKAFTDNNEGYTINRYKGLGEMNPDTLWETSMNPATRRLRRVTIEDYEEAVKSLNVCMSTDVQSRKEFLYEHL